VTVDHDEQQCHHRAEQPAHAVGLRRSRWIEEAREVQAHLQPDHLAAQLDGGEHDAHREAERQPHQHLLGRQQQRGHRIERHRRHGRQRGLRRHRDEERERNAHAHRHHALTEHGQ
jgi:hypothetical protein